MHCDLRVKQMTETINRNMSMVYRLAFSMVKTIQDAEDIRQEVMLQYIRTNPTFTSREHEKAWFIRVTSNLCKNLWKTAWRQKTVSMDSVREGRGEADGRKIICNQKDGVGISQEQEALTDEEERVIEAVKYLSMKYRVVIHLFYYEEMSTEEIAEALRLKPSNVRARLTRARKMLKKWLKEDV